MTTIFRSHSTRYAYVIEIGMPHEPVCVGQGDTLAEALENLTPMPSQSAGTWTRERKLGVIAAACDENAEDLDEDLGFGVPLEDDEGDE